MIIRKAKHSDSASIANYLMLAMEQLLYEFISKEDYDTAYTLLLYFVSQKDNQYSYENCIVAEIDDEVVGAVNYYDGEKLIELREPILNYVRDNFNKKFNPENETQAGEYYIDTLGVAPHMQGKGIGTRLLQYLIDHYTVKQQQTLGLLVDKENPDARKLYMKLGFKSVGKKILVGHEMEHLQINSLF